MKKLLMVLLVATPATVAMGQKINQPVQSGIQGEAPKLIPQIQAPGLTEEPLAKSLIGTNGLTTDPEARK